MSGKYLKKKKKNKLLRWIVVILCILAAAIAAVLLLNPQVISNNTEETEGASPIPSTEFTPAEETTEPVVTIGSIPVETHDMYELGNGLQIDRIDNYTGIYMEDGSDELVSGILMISLTNQSDQDVQLARIRLRFENNEAQFEATNLPAGSTVILLEKNRMEYSGQEPVSSELEAVLFFTEPMDVHADVLQIEGIDGMLTVTNISGTDLEGDIYVYYKNTTGAAYYGGITYRAKISGGLKAEESSTLMANHYFADTSAVVLVETGR